jgi:hypothetical protein
MHPATVRVPVVMNRDAGQVHASASDVLAVEEPFEIRVVWEEGGATRDQAISVTMR